MDFVDGQNRGLRRRGKERGAANCHTRREDCAVGACCAIMLNKFTRQVRVAGQRHILPCLTAIGQFLNDIAIRRRQRDRVAAIVQAKPAAGRGDDLRAAKIARGRPATKDDDVCACRERGFRRKYMLHADAVRDRHAGQINVAVTGVHDLDEFVLRCAADLIAVGVAKRDRCIRVRQNSLITSEGRMGGASPKDCPSFTVPGVAISGPAKTKSPPSTPIPWR